MLPERSAVEAFLPEYAGGGFRAGAPLSQGVPCSAVRSIPISATNSIFASLAALAAFDEIAPEFARRSAAATKAVECYRSEDADIVFS